MSQAAEVVAPWRLRLALLAAQAVFVPVVLAGLYLQDLSPSQACADLNGVSGPPGTRIAFWAAAAAQAYALFWLSAQRRMLSEEETIRAGRPTTVCLLLCALGAWIGHQWTWAFATWALTAAVIVVNVHIVLVPTAMAYVAWKLVFGWRKFRATRQSVRSTMTGVAILGWSTLTMFLPLLYALAVLRCS